MYKVVAGYFPIMEQLSKILSELDVLTTFASVINASAGADTPWCRPHFKDSIKGTRLHHPCLRTCVPNDCDISKYRTIILTGPNMGGKSTYIRTIGLVTYLAHLGCYVPAK
jgi:DNA mismatch repair ATPase MutS